MSKGENRITDLLNKAKVSFEREKTFSDLRGGKLRFDFYLPYLHGGDCIIEYNGEQHYQYVSKFYKNQAEMRKAQGRDMRKIQYCLTHGITLYIVPFWELDNINSLSDILCEKFRARDRYKNLSDYQNYKTRHQKN